ncbi:hypothetical protein NE237_007137 [Protea cynaroides]|uniref:Uncharacterized protein n=1 Tax=Protea cynaroides TaxID=273540 RepID=A0A9Q0QVY5_9MAGN|nr:hypothetical protein NE237_007137 [Protea cynaroides]
MPLSLNQTTSLKIRKVYARICVNIPSSKKPSDKIQIEDDEGNIYIQPVHYEWQLPHCISYKVFGHNEGECPLKPKQSGEKYSGLASTDNKGNGREDSENAGKDPEFNQMVSQVGRLSSVGLIQNKDNEGFQQQKVKKKNKMHYYRVKKTLQSDLTGRVDRVEQVTQPLGLHNQSALGSGLHSSSPAPPFSNPIPVPTSPNRIFGPSRFEVLSALPNDLDQSSPCLTIVLSIENPNPSSKLVSC